MQSRKATPISPFTFRGGAAADVGEGAEGDEQAGEAEADDEGFAVHDAQFHEQVAAEAAPGQTANEQPPARVEGCEHHEHNCRRQVEPDVQSNVGVVTMTHGIDEQGPAHREAAFISPLVSNFNFPHTALHFVVLKRHD